MAFVEKDAKVKLSKRTLEVWFCYVISLGKNERQDFYELLSWILCGGDALVIGMIGTTFGRFKRFRSSFEAVNLPLKLISPSDIFKLHTNYSSKC